MKKLSVVLCLLLLFTASGCDLSHKHYYNDLGKCNCGSDIATPFSYNATTKEYVTETRTVVAGETYYYKFVAHGEPFGCSIISNPETIGLDRIELHYPGSAPYDTALIFEPSVGTYTKSLYDGKTYNLKITFESSGDVTLRIKPFNERQQ